MVFARIPLLLSVLYLAQAEQPSAPSALKAPVRDIPWAKKGGLNFLHTTDTHGWHAGHLQEAQYSADWGDVLSFTHHLRKRADDDGSDLLVIETGDRVEGNGLYDASRPRGKYTLDIIKQQRFDVVTCGNHELYINTTSQREYEDVVPKLKDSYIASNLDIRDPKSGKGVPFAPRFRKFKTKNQGINIIAFGFMFDFKGNANNTIVQPVENTIKEQWFKDALNEKDVDLFLVAGHVPVRDAEEFDIIYKAIRDEKWDTPIVFFGGHSHIRDYRKWEKKAQGIESGRYMETIGFMSIDGLGSIGSKDVDVARNGPDYKRMYIDNNLYSLHHHSLTNSSTFDTELGRNVSAAIHEDRKALKLDKTYGCAPHAYWLNRAPYPSDDSLLTLLDSKILPDTFAPNKSSSSAGDKKPSIILTNSGALRFDVFEGPFTTDTVYLVCPFTSGFRKITNVPYKVAKQVMGILNNEGPIPLKDLLSFVGEDERPNLGDLMGPLPPVNQKMLWESSAGEEFAGYGGGGEQIPIGDSKTDDDGPQIPGYTTKDDAGSDGDDTVHKEIKFYNIPNVVGTNIGFSPKTEDDKPGNLDLVYNEFVQDWVLLALRYLGLNYGKENTKVALEGKTMTDVIREWVGENWECKGDGG